jgi:hypothetical protein
VSTPSLKAALVSCLVLAGACGSREHMSDGYGRNQRTFFARQHVYARAATGSPAGADSEEAAVIQANYRKTLGAEHQDTSKDAPSRVLLLETNPNAKPPTQ